MVYTVLAILLQNINKMFSATSPISILNFPQKLTQNNPSGKK